MQVGGAAGDLTLYTLVGYAVDEYLESKNEKSKTDINVNIDGDENTINVYYTGV